MIKKVLNKKSKRQKFSPEDFAFFKFFENLVLTKEKSYIIISL